jgi:hypothetical protein
VFIVVAVQAYLTALINGIRHRIERELLFVNTYRNVDRPSR